MLKVLFSGDTLFRGTMGSLSLPTSQSELMWKSLEKLSQLPLETVVYPGHASRTTIGRESWLSDAKNIFG
jgi:glyoxylase-like metal-dependent hydrolase (beta-lactamase superfamily II)